MAVLTLAALEERVSQLEEMTARLVADSQDRPPGAWRKVVGIFGEDELMKQIDEEGKRWRAEENRRSLS